jgi:hypothetical protein
MTALSKFSSSESNPTSGATANLGLVVGEDLFLACCGDVQTLIIQDNKIQLYVPHTSNISEPPSDFTRSVSPRLRLLSNPQSDFGFSALEVGSLSKAESTAPLTLHDVSVRGVHAAVSGEVLLTLPPRFGEVCALCLIRIGDHTSQDYGRHQCHGHGL